MMSTEIRDETGFPEKYPSDFLLTFKDSRRDDGIIKMEATEENILSEINDSLKDSTDIGDTITIEVLNKRELNNNTIQALEHLFTTRGHWLKGKMSLEIIFFDTPAHGYYKVPVDILRKLGLEDSFSGDSPEYKGFKYIEEDGDAVFLFETLDKRQISYSFIAKSINEDFPMTKTGMIGIPPLSMQ